MKLGYPVISFTLEPKGITPYRKLEGSFESQREIYLENLKDLLSTLVWNQSVGIKFYRLSNTFGSFYNEAFAEDVRISDLLSKIGDFANEHGHRLSFHCSNYNVLGSPKNNVRFNSRREIESLSKFFDLIGMKPSQWNKINLHIGGAYGEREKTAENWIRSWEKLSHSAKERVVVENDDKSSLYSVNFLYEHIYKKTGVAITFDSFHHNFCNNGETKEEAAKTAASTWKTEPCFHFASSMLLNEEKSVPTSHAKWVYEEIEDWGTGAWIMVEAKSRDLAVLKYLNEKLV